MPVHVIITAGGELPAELRALSPSPVKALLRVGTQSLLERAVAAAETCAQVGAIAVVGNDDVLRATPRTAMHVEAGKNLVDNLYRGFLHHGGDLGAEYLLLSPDLPFVSGAALSELIAAARDGSELALPVVRGADFQARFPDSPNRFEHIDGAPLTMGSAVYITGRMLKTNVPLFHDFIRFRKSPLKLAALLGLPLAFAYLRKRLTLAQLEHRAGQLTGGVVRAVTLRDAGIAYDVDTQANYDYALTHIQRLEGGG
jgi:GTP:adenosylcobinamide-phosphate guanylyltransferase